MQGCFFIKDFKENVATLDAGWLFVDIYTHVIIPWNKKDPEGLSHWKTLGTECNYVLTINGQINTYFLDNDVGYEFLVHHCITRDPLKLLLSGMSCFW